LKPHDLRRHAATYASRSGTPIEIVSKILLRHSSVIPQKVTVVIRIIAISWHIAQSNKSSYLEGQREG
jgi:hypothetical protein